MWSTDSFARFERALELDCQRGEVSFGDVVSLAEKHGLSLGEASAALQDEKRWQRVFVDALGQVVHPDVAASALAQSAFGGRCPYRVTWRRAGPQSGYLLA
jgi:hypothetical protein